MYSIKGKENYKDKRVYQYDQQYYEEAIEFCRMFKGKFDYAEGIIFI